MRSHYKRFIGKQYGFLIVQKVAFNKNGCNHYECLCICGKLITRSIGNLGTGERTKVVISCGCNGRFQNGLVQCSKCLVFQNKKDFHISRTKEKGIASECKKCRLLIAKTRYLNFTQADKDRINKNRRRYEKKQKLNNPLFSLKKNVSRRLNLALKVKNWSKKSKFYDYLGCNKKQFKLYLELQFQVGMDWNNYGLWHVDHIIPLSSAKTEQEMYKLCHYTNLQPLWAKDNLSKGAKLPCNI